MKRYVGLLAIVVVIAGFPAPARAQPAPDEGKLLVAPYLMGAVMSGETTVRGVGVDVDVLASDVFSNLQFGASIVGRDAGDAGGDQLSGQYRVRTAIATARSEITRSNYQKVIQ